MKKTLSVILVTLLALALTGCNNASGITEPTTQPTRPVATTPVQTTPAPTTPPTTPAPTEPTTAEPVEEDPLWLLETTFEIAEKDGGFYLLRGEKIYSLSSTQSPNQKITYPNRIDTTRTTSGEVFFYLMTRTNVHISVGEVPVPILEKTDKIIFIGDTLRDLELYSIEPIGYSFYVGDTGKDGSFSGVKDESGQYISLKNAINIAIRDSNGQLADNYHNLRQGEKYSLSWYIGTKYYEVSELTADCFMFEYGDRICRIKGELTTDGYAVYDLSSVPSGTCMVEYGGGLLIIP